MSPNNIDILGKCVYGTIRLRHWNNILRVRMLKRGIALYPKGDGDSEILSSSLLIPTNGQMLVKPTYCKYKGSFYLPQK